MILKLVTYSIGAVIYYCLYTCHNNKQFTYQCPQSRDLQR